ncbi:MAG: hypothetical protein ABR976_08065 [Terracidiphilus sp.]|jgi:hypothetical protein
MTPINPFIAAAEVAMSKQRAVKVRKKLVKAAAAIESASDPGQTLLINQWTGAHDSPFLTGDEYRSAASGRDSDLG